MLIDSPLGGGSIQHPAECSGEAPAAPLPRPARLLLYPVVCGRCLVASVLHSCDGFDRTGAPRVALLFLLCAHAWLCSGAEPQGMLEPWDSKDPATTMHTLRRQQQIGAGATRMGAD